MMAEFWDWLGRITGLKNIDSGSASLAAGLLALLAGYLAWHAIQNQIKEQRRVEERQRQHDRKSLVQALTAEVIALMPQIIRDLSHFNEMSHSFRSQRADPTEPFPDRVVYMALLDRVGELDHTVHTAVLVEFHSNLSDYNAMGSQIKPVPDWHGVTNFDLARSLRKIARNAADLLRMLNPDLPFGGHLGFDPKTLYCPDGGNVARFNPENMLVMLRRMAGPGAGGQVGSSYPWLDPEPPLRKATRDRWTKLRRLFAGEG